MVLATVFRRCLIMLGVFFLFSPLQVSAMRITPDSSDIDVIAGVTSVANIFVKNDHASAEDYKISFMKVEFGESAEDLRFSRLTAEESEWFVARPATFTLGSQAEQRVDVEVNVPNSASSKTMTLAVLVEERSQIAGAAVVTPAAASLLFIHADEVLKGELELVHFEASPNWVTKGGVQLSTIFRNIGNDSAIVTSEVRVVNMFGGEVDRFPLSYAPKHLPPGTVRSLSAIWPQDRSFRPMTIGEYTFEIVHEGESLGSTKVVFLSSLNGIVIVGVGIAFLLGILMLVRRYR